MRRTEICSHSSPSVNANISQQEHSVYESTQDKLDKKVKWDLGFSDGLQ